MKILKNKTFIQVLSVIVIFVIMITTFTLISQAVQGGIDIHIGVNEVQNEK